MMKEAADTMIIRYMERRQVQYEAYLKEMEQKGEKPYPFYSWMRSTE